MVSEFSAVAQFLMPDSDRKPIFISYRRTDEPFAATLIYDKLADAFGGDRIFKDVDSFEPGDDFPEKLAQFVEDSDVLLAIIGPKWLTAGDELGRRIDNPLDWVRIEIASAIEQQKRVVPVLVNGAEMPRTDELPVNLQPLAHKHAFRVSADHAGPESRGLIKSLERMLEQAVQERSDAELQAQAEAKRREEEEAARKRDAELKAEQKAGLETDLSPSEVEALRATHNWEYIKSRRNIEEHRDHIARFPKDESARFAFAALDKMVWEGTDLSSMDDLETYLSEFSNGVHLDEATNELSKLREEKKIEESRAAKLIEEQAAWADVAAKGKTELIHEFLERFPDGEHALDAQKRLRELRQLPRRGVITAAAAGIAGVGLGAWQMLPQNYLWRLLNDQSVRVFTGHSEPVRSVAIAPDGKTALSGGEGGSLQIWDLATGELVRYLAGNNMPIWSVAFAPDGKTALSGGEGFLALWDVETGRLIKDFEWNPDYWIYSAAFTPDGQRVLASAGRGSIGVWDVATGKNISFDPVGMFVKSVAVAPDGNTVVYGAGNGIVGLWDITTREKGRIFEGLKGDVDSVAVSRDGATILACGGSVAIRVWDFSTGDNIWSLKGHSEPALCVAISPDGLTALSGGADRTVWLWNLKTGEAIRAFEGHTGSVLSVVFSPDGTTALSGSEDNTVRLWEVRGV